MSGWLEPLPSKRVRAVYRDSTGHRHSQTFATRKGQGVPDGDADRPESRALARLDPRGGQMLFADWSAKWSEARLTRLSTAHADAGRLKNHLLPTSGA